jgi:hypothetical protein
VIQEAIIAYVMADATIQANLGSGTSCRLYPDEAPKDPTTPYAVWRVQSDPGRTKGNLANELLLGFSIFAPTKLAAETIKRRLDVLLDKDTAIAVSSGSIKVHSCWLYGGNSMYEQATKLHHRVALYALLYN